MCLLAVNAGWPIMCVWLLIATPMRLWPGVPLVAAWAEQKMLRLGKIWMMVLPPFLWSHSHRATSIYLLLMKQHAQFLCSCSHAKVHLACRHQSEGKN